MYKKIAILALFLLCIISAFAFAGAVQLPQTGQTTCYDTSGAVIDCAGPGNGQDGDLRMGVAWPEPRFTDNGNGTVTDNLTGLIWLKNANCFGKQTWAKSISSANSLASGACNLTDGSLAGDWRLPNRKELRSLVNVGQANSAVWLNGQGFTNVQADHYWPSSTSAPFTYYAWFVEMWVGMVDYSNKSSYAYVWPVRAVQSGSFNHFAVSSPASAMQGTPFNFTVTALDQYNNTVTGYSGTVHFTSSDTTAVLPADATLTSGTGTFPATLNSVGSWTITATDTATASATGTSKKIKVNAAFTLTVTKSGTGTGTVTSSLSGIDCGADCTEDYAKSAKVTLTPVPDKGSIFANWSGDCKGTGPCKVTMSADKSVDAVFNTGTCTYTISPKNKTLTYKGGTITIGVTAKGSTSCPAPEISQDGDWIGLTSTFAMIKGTVKLTIPEYDNSVLRTGTVTIGGNTFTITQNGKPCTLALSASSSELFSSAGGTGSFTVTATPSDCAWTATPAKTSTWVTISSGGSGTGSGEVDYSVAANTGKSARSGKITVVTTLNKKSKSYTVKQSNK